MNKYLLGLVAVFVVGGGIAYAVHTSKTPASPVQQPVGAASGNEHYNAEFFYNGLATNKWYGLSSVSASSTNPITSPASTVSLGAGASGQFTLGTSTPAVSAVYASTTAISSPLSRIFVQQTSSTTIASVTCNTTPVATLVKNMFVSSTAPTYNGFSVSVAAIPTTNPICYSYWILNTSQ